MLDRYDRLVAERHDVEKRHVHALARKDEEIARLSQLNAIVRLQSRVRQRLRAKWAKREAERRDELTQRATESEASLEKCKAESTESIGRLKAAIDKLRQEKAEAKATSKRMEKQLRRRAGEMDNERRKFEQVAAKSAKSQTDIETLRLRVRELEGEVADERRKNAQAVVEKASPPASPDAASAADSKKGKKKKKKKKNEKGAQSVESEMQDEIAVLRATVETLQIEIKTCMDGCYMYSVTLRMVKWNDVEGIYAGHIYSKKGDVLTNKGSCVVVQRDPHTSTSTLLVIATCEVLLGDKIFLNLGGGKEQPRTELGIIETAEPMRQTSNLVPTMYRHVIKESDGIIEERLTVNKYKEKAAKVLRILLTALTRKHRNAFDLHVAEESDSGSMFIDMDFEHVGDMSKAFHGLCSLQKKDEDVDITAVFEEHLTMDDDASCCVDLGGLATALGGAEAVLSLALRLYHGFSNKMSCIQNARAYEGLLVSQSNAFVGANVGHAMLVLGCSEVLPILHRMCTNVQPGIIQETLKRVIFTLRMHGAVRPRPPTAELPEDSPDIISYMTPNEMANFSKAAYRLELRTWDVCALTPESIKAATGDSNCAGIVQYNPIINAYDMAEHCLVTTTYDRVSSVKQNIDPDFTQASKDASRALDWMGDARTKNEKFHECLFAHRGVSDSPNVDMLKMGSMTQADTHDLKFTLRQMAKEMGMQKDSVSQNAFIELERALPEGPTAVSDLLAKLEKVAKEADDHSGLKGTV